MWAPFLEIDREALIKSLEYFQLNQIYDLNELTLDELAILARQQGIL